VIKTYKNLRGVIKSVLFFQEIIFNNLYMICCFVHFNSKKRNKNYNDSETMITYRKCEFTTNVRVAFSSFYSKIGNMSASSFLHLFFLYYLIIIIYFENIYSVFHPEKSVIPSLLFAQYFSMISALGVFKSYANPNQAMNSIKPADGLIRAKPNSEAL